MEESISNTESTEKGKELVDLLELHKSISRPFRWLSSKLNTLDHEDEKYRKVAYLQQKFSRCLIDCIRLEEEHKLKQLKQRNFVQDDDAKKDAVSLIRRIKKLEQQTTGDKKQLLLIKRHIAQKISLTVAKNSHEVRDKRKPTFRPKVLARKR